ncbi:Exodeoxyribonuclease I subunit D [Pseudomonas pohangensis]|uniref:Nuclease SbcCD subunit D n=1 Tax=Pseudomonas pohangensis TaxID=364197 RepID=A0A1H2DVE5_9PSED|nr:exonuclease subunit SbcD [Pseudomonas pohangensis]SDT86837.1 Exodeoxyribonuclease I subunit D [Pseudomonas pohangensis]
MRILHTSDWHLGQHFMGKTRQAEHQAFLGWLVDQVKEHQVDAVLVAGDIFDTGTPPSYAREMYSEFVVAMRRSGAELIVLGGNHDSVAMLGENKSLLAELNARVIPGVAETLGDQLLVVKQRDGTPGAILCAIPFIRPRDVTTSLTDASAKDRQVNLQKAIQSHYAALYQLAVDKRMELGAELPIVATGHLTTVGASASESVREIYVGSLEAFPTSAFPPADYIALGHIHRPQKVGGHEHIRYSGSPIPLSFDETGQQKNVLLVDLDAGGLQQVEALDVPLFQPLLSLRGSLKELEALIADAAQQGSGQTPVWLEIMVTSDDYLSDLQSRLLLLTDGLPVEVLRTRRQRGDVEPTLPTQRETLEELSPTDVFSKRLEAETLDPQLQEQLGGLYQQVIAQLAEEPV